MIYYYKLPNGKGFFLPLNHEPDIPQPLSLQPSKVRIVSVLKRGAFLLLHTLSLDGTLLYQSEG